MKPNGVLGCAVAYLIQYFFMVAVIFVVTRGSCPSRSRGATSAAPSRHAGDGGGVAGRGRGTPEHLPTAIDLAAFDRALGIVTASGRCWCCGRRRSRIWCRPGSVATRREPPPRLQRVRTPPYARLPAAVHRAAAIGSRHGDGRLAQRSTGAGSSRPPCARPDPATKTRRRPRTDGRGSGSDVTSWNCVLSPRAWCRRLLAGLFGVGGGAVIKSRCCLCSFGVIGVPDALRHAARGRHLARRHHPYLIRSFMTHHARGRRGALKAWRRRVIGGVLPDRGSPPSAGGVRWFVFVAWATAIASASARRPDHRERHSGRSRAGRSSAASPGCCRP